jgi:hypothetical protein
MPRQPIDISSDTYVAISEAQAKRRCINLYKHVDDGQSLSQQIIVGAPGISSFCSVDYPICRGFIETKTRAFGVYSDQFIEFDSVGTVTYHGSVANNASSNPVRMASNGFTVVIITDNNGYFFDLSTDTLSEIADPIFSSYGTVLDVKYKDGYFFYITEDYIFNGSLVTDNEGKDFTALEFGSAEIEPDGNVACGVLNNQYYVFGQNTIEIFETTDSTGFPLQRIPGAAIQKGCVARDTVINFQGALTFLGKDRGETPALWLCQGSNIVKISTPAIENYVQSLTSAQWDDACCWSYQQGGSNFLVFDIGDATFVYDATSSEKSGRAIWHERQSGSIDWIGYEKWVAKFSISAFGNIYVGDRSLGRIGKIDYSVYKEYGERIPRGINSQPFDSEYSSVSQVELFCEMGVGNSDIENPSILLSYSEDQGKTFNNPVEKYFGEAGQYTGRMVWNRLGRIQRPRVFRLYTDDPCKIRILKMEAVIE